MQISIIFGLQTFRGHTGHARLLHGGHEPCLTLFGIASVAVLRIFCLLNGAMAITS